MITHSSPQPNVPGRGIIAGYQPRFWGLVIIIGLGAGLGGALLTVILRSSTRPGPITPARC
jgi:hypothetical protein